MTRHTLAAIIIPTAAAASVGVAALTHGSGGQPGPRDVARAYYAAEFDCGEKGAGKQYDLSTSQRTRWTRQQHLDYQRRHGCTPRPVPTMEVTLLPGGNDDIQAVKIAPRATGAVFAPGVLVVVREDTTSLWKVDTSQSREPREV